MLIKYTTFCQNITTLPKIYQTAAKIYKMFLKFTKRQHHLLTLSINYLQGPPKFTQTGDFGTKILVASGSPRFRPLADSGANFIAQFFFLFPKFFKLF
jgi:hypothetical protein